MRRSPSFKIICINDQCRQQKPSMIPPCAYTRQKTQKNLQRSVSNRCVYINEQIRKKTQKNSMQTIFHSPFKNGVRNKDYLNPSFMTSDVIYQMDFKNNSSQTPKRAIIHTQAELKQKALYNQRMRRSSSYMDLSERIRNNSHSIKKKTKLRQLQQKREKINLRNSPQNVKMNAQLKIQLQNLMKYKKQRQLKQSQKINQSRYMKTPIKKQLPIYFQKVYSNPNYQLQCQQKKRSELKQWLGINQQLSKLRKQIQRQKANKQTKHMIKNVQNYQRNVQQQVLGKRKNQILLAKILKQQIKNKERQKELQRKQKAWRVL